MSRVLACIVVVCILLSSLPVLAVDVSAQSCILMDAESGRVLMSRDCDGRRLIASTTKVMTAYTALKLADPDEKVEVPYHLLLVEGSSMGLRPDEEITLRELLYGLLMLSGNDAALVIAGHCGGGDVDVFVEAMNEQARLLGLTNTHFENPHGLDGKTHYSSARDLALLTAAAYREFPLFTEIVSSKTAQIAGRSMRNHNKMLWNYEGADGVKTGFTKAAGRTLVSSATRNSQRLIAVTLNDPQDWKDTAALFDYGFDNYPRIELTAAGREVVNLSIVSGTVSQVSVRALSDCAYPLSQEERARLTRTVKLPRFVFAPVAAGDVIGSVEYRLDGELIAESPLVFGADVPEAAAPTMSVWQLIVSLFG